MKIHFWGVRGSLPTPIVPEQIQSKIMAVVQRIQPSDLENGETRARFVASLPDWILGTTGGNTPCVEIQDGNTEIILDAGTGIRVLGKNPSNITSNHFHLFFSHYLMPGAVLIAFIFRAFHFLTRHIIQIQFLIFILLRKIQKNYLENR